MEVQLTDRVKIERSISILDWGIVLSILVLFVAIFIPASIWKEEAKFRNESRHRMHIIADAEEFFYELTNRYTTNGEELFAVVEAATDSLIADSLFVDEQKIILNGKTYTVNVSKGFDMRVDTTFTKPQILQRTFNDTMYLVSLIDEETGDIIKDWANKDLLKIHESDSLFQSVDSVQVVERTEKYTDYLRNRYHLTKNLLYCPLTGKPYILEIDNTDPDYPVFTVKSPVPPDYKERRFGVFSFEAGNHGYIRNREASWAERD